MESPPRVDRASHGEERASTAGEMRVNHPWPGLDWRMRCFPIGAAPCCAAVLLSVSACTPPGPADLPTPATRPDDTDPVTGQTLKVVGYNVQSGEATSAGVSALIEEVTGEHLWGFSELASQAWLDAFLDAADDGGQDFQGILGTTGGANLRLALAYDASVLELLGSTELHDINVSNTVRAPLVGHFRVAANGVEFKAIVNHLWRGDDAGRHEQAELLNDWADGESLPLIAVGDYNFDWAVDGGESDHDPGYDRMTANGVWSWVRPAELIATQCSFAFDGVLDFVFVGNAAKNWSGTSEILFRQNVYCQDSPDTPDHRPVTGTFFVPDP